MCGVYTEGAKSGELDSTVATGKGEGEQEKVVHTGPRCGEVCIGRRMRERRDERPRREMKGEAKIELAVHEIKCVAKSLVDIEPEASCMRVVVVAVVGYDGEYLRAQRGGGAGAGAELKREGRQPKRVAPEMRAVCECVAGHAGE